MIKGSCCCGAVQFLVSEPPALVGTCHCSRCRKVGASTIAFVKRDDFQLLQGKDQIQSYLPEEGYKYTRSFCRTCGSSLGEIGTEADSFPIPANLFDDAIDLTVQFHEFVSEKPSWYSISDSGKQFEGHPKED